MWQTGVSYVQAVAPQQASREAVLFPPAWLGPIRIIVVIRGVNWVDWAKCQANGLQCGQAGKYAVQGWRFDWRPDAGNIQVGEGA